MNAPVSSNLRSQLGAILSLLQQDYPNTAQDRLRELIERLPDETPAEPKIGDEVALHIPLSEGFGGVRPPNDGWKISRIDRPQYVFLKHPNGSEITLLPGQFSVKTSDQSSGKIVKEPQ